MDRKSIINRVLAKMDEFGPFGQGLLISSGASQIKPIESYIDLALDENCQQVLLVVPYHLIPCSVFNTTATTPANIVIDSNNIATIILPSDYLKLAYLNFPCFERPIIKTITETEPMYIVQKNQYTRAKFAKPVACIKTNTASKKVLEVFTVQNDDTNKNGGTMVYVKNITVDMLPNNISPLVISLTASKIMAQLGNPNTVACEREFTNMLNLLTTT